MSFYTHLMRLTNRDDQILRFTARFKQVTSGQVAAAFFDTNKSETRVRDVLARLAREDYLRRMERQVAGGTHGGSGQYVYCLGAKGYRWLTPRGGTYKPERTTSRHTVGITEAYIAMLKASRAGHLTLNTYMTEPDTWLKVEGIELRPDLLLEYERFGEPHFMWVEFDTGTESRRDLITKLSQIVEARELSGVYEVTEPDGCVSHEVVGLVPFPEIVFIVPDAERREQIRAIVRRLGKPAVDVFRCVLAADYPLDVV